MSLFIWESPQWPKIRLDEERLLPVVSEARSRQHYLLGALSLSSPEERLAATADALSVSALDSSAIEGELLVEAAVRSSVARRLGLDKGGVLQGDRTEGVVEMTLEAVREYDQALTHKRLWKWHAGLFPGTIERAAPSAAGRYRVASEDPMQVVSGPVGRPRIHFEAPSGSQVPTMMDEFLLWFNASREREDGLLRAARAHLWFVTIHPFHDGNGRITRAITDMALAQDEKSRDRFYSFSAQILRERAEYYRELESAQHGTLDVTRWAGWFVGCFMRAIEASENVIERARRAMHFWTAHKHVVMNARQKRVLLRLLNDFEGKLNLRKYVAITKTSDATAQRDLAELVAADVLTSVGAGKATHYLPCGVNVGADRTTTET